MLIKLNRATPHPNHSGRGGRVRPKGAEGKERGPKEQVWLPKGQQKETWWEPQAWKAEPFPSRSLTDSPHQPCMGSGWATQARGLEAKRKGAPHRLLGQQ